MTITHPPPPSIPAGDVLIHAGDLANAGNVSEIQTQLTWLNSLPHPHKIVIAGNHDSHLDPVSRAAVSDPDASEPLDWGDIHYLQRSSVTLALPNRGNRKLHVYGAPDIPACGGADFAFQYAREEGGKVWRDRVPMETDVLVTHSPPRWHLDLPQGMGCAGLLEECWRVRPRVHVFGHVHAGYGREEVWWDEGQRVYERLCARGEKGLLGGLLAVGAWVDVLMLVWYGVLGVLWSRVWGGDAGGCVMINASLSYRSTGRLGNAVQVVEI